MARIKERFYNDDSDDSYWIVERNDGQLQKTFYSRDEAERYKDYLQSIENEEKAISQNEEIIKNQQSILKQRQRIDPEYEEWLRFKKDTDPEFKKWKENEIRRQKEEERRRKEEEAKRIKLDLERKREESIRQMNQSLLSMAPKFEQLKQYFAVFDQVLSVKNRYDSIPYISSRKIEYVSKLGIEEFHTSIGGGSFRDQFYLTLKNDIQLIGDINAFFEEMKVLAVKGDENLFKEKEKIIFKTYNDFHGEYFVFLSQLEYGVARSKWTTVAHYNLTYSPDGFFQRKKVERVISEFNRDAAAAFKTIRQLHQELRDILKQFDFVR